MSRPAPLFIDHIDAAVDHVLDTVKGDIVLGLPLGIGKPNAFANALYKRIKGTPARKLRIIRSLRSTLAGSGGSRRIHTSRRGRSSRRFGHASRKTAGSFREI